MAKKRQKFSIDMTEGSPLRIMLLFSAPMILSNLFQQLYNIIDTLIVGRALGQDPLAAVGSAGTVTLVYTSAAAGMALGASVVIAQLFGARELRRVKTCASTIGIFNTLVGLLFLLVGVFLAKPILELIKTPSGILDVSTTYLRVYSVGCVAMFLYNALSAVYIALGNSKTPLYFLILSSLLNIGLDLLFVLVFHWGVAGAAWATTISQMLSAVLALFDLRGKLRLLPTDAPAAPFDRQELGTMLKYALPATIQQSVVSVGNVVVQSAINSFGEAVMAGCTAASKVFSFVTTIPGNFGNAVSNFTGQNIGAQKPERISKGLAAALVASGIICLLMTGVFQLWGEAIIGLFAKKGEAPEAIRVGVSYISTVSWFFVAFAIMMCTKNVLKGAGDMSWFILSTMVDFVVRVLAAIFLSPIYGAHLIWWSIPIGWCTGMVIAVIRYLQGGWRKKSILKEEKKEASPLSS